MALQLSDVIRSARDRHAAFAKPRVPDAVFARYLTDYQRTLVSRCVHRNPTYLAQVATIGFALSSANDVGAFGSNANGASPATVSSDGVTLAVAESPVGQSVQLATGTAVQLVSPTVVSAATATTLSATGTAWSTNAYVGDTVEIVDGPAAGQQRVIQSNTSGQVTVAAWDQVPTAGISRFRITTTVLATDATTFGVADLPAQTTSRSYLVKLDATGTPYVDTAHPLIATVSAGMTLPPTKRLLGGTVRFTSSTNVEPFTLVSYQERFTYQDWRAFAGYVLNGQLFLIGDAPDWSDVASIELRYVPEPPALAALTDYFLLPDAAMPCLIARSAYMAGVRLQGMPDVPRIDVQSLAAEASEAETAFLAEVGAQGRTFTRRIREVW